MTPTKAEEITNPRRILAVALTDSSDHLGAVIRDLTGTAPTPQQQPSSSPDEDPSAPSSPSDHPTSTETEPSPSLAGTTHPLPLSTPYYTASIPIWLDLISSPADWSASFLSEEAKEVLGVLGGVVCVFEVPSSKSTGGSSLGGGEVEAQREKARKEKTKELIEGVGKVVREGLGGWEWEGVGLAVGVTTIGGGKVGETTEMDADVDMEDEINEWDDLCAEFGLEFVHHRVVPDVGSKGKEKNDERNEYGEKMGIARVLEALQSNDWSGGDGGAGSTEGDDNNNRGPFDESEDEEDYVDENDWDTEDEFDLGFGYTKKQKMEMRKAFWKGTADSNRTTEEELEAFKRVTQTVDGSIGNSRDAMTKKKAREGFWKQLEEEVQEMKNKRDGKGESAAATDAAKAGPSAGSGAADKAKKEEKEDDEEEAIGEEDVERIAKMMLKLQAVRDMSGTVSEEQRRKLALKAVEEVMRDL